MKPIVDRGVVETLDDLHRAIFAVMEERGEVIIREKFARTPGNVEVNHGTPIRS